MKVRGFIGILFLLLQVGGIAYARFTPERFFCWAPYDQHTKFEVFVTIDGNTLSHEETVARYQYKMRDWEQRSIHNVMSLISQYENTYGYMDNANVLMRYSINGHQEQEWTFEHD